MTKLMLPERRTAAVRERPILFSGRLVLAINEDRKSVTRRTTGLEQVNAAPDEWEFLRVQDGYPDGRPRFVFEYEGEPIGVRCPYGEPGDYLWVREAFRPISVGGWPDHRWCGIQYRADEAMIDRPMPEDARVNLARRTWRPSIHLPRWASRTQLEVTEVRVERLQEITREEAIAEGVERETADVSAVRAYLLKGSMEVDRFAQLWDQLNAPRGYGWQANPWLWVVRFRRIR